MSKNILFSLIILCSFSCADSQDKKSQQESEATSTSTPGQEAQENFKARYPQAENVEWGTDSNGYQEASFVFNGKKLRADFDKDGSWIETEESIKYEDLPSTVREIIEADYDKDDISEIEEVDHHSDGKFYDIEFKQKGKNQDIKITPGGEILPE